MIVNYLAIEFQNLLRQPRVRVRQAPAIEPPARAGQNQPGPRPPDQPPTPLIDESDIDNSPEPQLLQVRKLKWDILLSHYRRYCLR